MMLIDLRRQWRPCWEPATSDDAPGDVSGKNQATSDDTAADHADGQISGKGTDSIGD